jgi:hypothetical protein
VKVSKVFGRIGVGFLGAIGLIIATALWLYTAEPWLRFDDTLVDRLAGTGTPRDQHGDLTHRLSGILPEGMLGEDAFRLLSRNGFSCASAVGTSNGNQRVTCKRTVSHFPCGGTYTVELLLSNTSLVVGRTATSTYVCV